MDGIRWINLCYARNREPSKKMANTVHAVTQAVEASLSQAWGFTVSLQKCRSFKKKRVLRCSANSVPDDMPRDFLVKTPRLRKGESYDPSDDILEGGPWRFRNECAALTLLGQSDRTTGIVPRLLAVDHESGLFAYEYLRRTRTFRDLFRTGLDESTEIALQVYAQTMAEFHGQSFGRRQEWLRIRGGWDQKSEIPIEQFQRRLQQLTGRRLPLQADQDLVGLGDKHRTSDKMSLLHVDYAPQNYLWNGETVWLIDFEYAHFGLPPMDFALRFTPFYDSRWPSHHELIARCRNEYIDRFLEITSLTQEEWHELEIDALVVLILQQLPERANALKSETKTLLKEKLLEIERRSTAINYMLGLAHLFGQMQQQF